ncbi:uncharacterized protein LOC130927669 isoform X4 [Corythoichthys intestinalis]|uniref:uncharacterized protein LOC130927669 isoform X4 n=1 Tax=Corythoichthys intestinalis TaxID=161448 RepID=UPI0025A51F75|nr:uncharacterized protein LOC130927669 isoform X4 [Corythoichthys intestinalis]
MSARPEELCGVKEEPPCHRHSTVCKLMHAKVVLHRLEDLYVSQARYSEHLESACIKDEEEEWSSIQEAFIHMKGFRKYLGAERQEAACPGVELPQIKEEEEPEPCQQKQLPIKKEEEELPYVKEEEEEEHITRSNGLHDCRLETRRGETTTAASHHNPPSL